MEKLKDVLILLVLILSIVFLLLAILINPVENLVKNDKMEIKENENTGIEENKDIQINTVFIDNMSSLFSVYTGEIQRIDVSKFIRNIVLDKLYNLKNIYNSQEYFDGNKDEIEKQYGITNYIDFENLFNYVKNYEKDVKSISIIGDSVKKQERVTSFDIKVTFNSENSMVFNCIINNNLSESNPNIVFLSK